MARILETVEFTDVNADTLYNFQFNLSQFQRASALAPNFKFYKAAKVTWTLEALYNTFQENNGGTGISQPYLYTVMNRTQDNTGQIVSDLQAMGAKPKKFIGKHILAYRPNWCSPGLSIFTAGTDTILNTSSPLSQGLKTQYAWLACPNTNGVGAISTFVPTNSTTYPPGTLVAPAKIIANQVVYNGHSIFVDQLVPPSAPLTVGRLTCTVEWHFKDPHFTGSPRSAVTVAPAHALMKSTDDGSLVLNV
jgi:hypothetical protein